MATSRFNDSDQDEIFIRRTVSDADFLRDGYRGMLHRQHGLQSLPRNLSGICTKSEIWVRSSESAPTPTHRYSDGGGYANALRVTTFWMELKSSDGTSQNIPLRKDRVSHETTMFRVAAMGSSAQFRTHKLAQIQVMLIAEHPTESVLPFLDLDLSRLVGAGAGNSALPELLSSDAFEDGGVVVIQPARRGEVDDIQFIDFSHLVFSVPQSQFPNSVKDSRTTPS